MISDKQYHGRPCKRCARTLRWVASRDCVACHRARARADYYAQREHVLAYQCHYRATHAAKLAAYNRAWYAARPDYKAQRREADAYSLHLLGIH